MPRYFVMNIPTHTHTHTHTHDHSCGRLLPPCVGPSGPSREGELQPRLRAPRGGAAHRGDPYPLSYPPARFATRSQASFGPVNPTLFRPPRGALPLVPAHLWRPRRRRPSSRG